MAVFSPSTQLDKLDHLAQAILGEGHAMMEANTKKLKTSDASLRCVAVMEIGGTLLVAANNFFVTKNMIDSVGKRNPKKLWTDRTTVKKNINQADPIVATTGDLFDIFSDTSADGRARLGYDRVIFVTGVHTYMNNYHAEMQILQFMLDYKLKTSRRFIGVSKPCCPECAAILKVARISFTEGHANKAHVVRNVNGARFSHPNLVGASLADRLGTELLSPGGAHEAPF
jgi:hypothetical protein